MKIAKIQISCIAQHLGSLAIVKQFNNSLATNFVTDLPAHQRFASMEKKQRLSHSALPQDLSLFCDEDMSPEQVHVASQAKTVPRSKVGSGPKVALMLH